VPGEFDDAHDDTISAIASRPTDATAPRIYQPPTASTHPDQLTLHHADTWSRAT
jgi:hypothetical protein